MRTTKLLLLLLLISNNALAQCYSKIVSYSRNYIALQTDGTLWSKGTTFNRRLLGFGDVPAPTEFTQIGTNNNWTENISINSSNVFAIKADGRLWVWGTNGVAAGLGSDDNVPFLIPTQVGADTNWAKVSSGFGMTLAVKTDGTLWSWGINNVGQLGIGNLDNTFTSNVPIQVGTDTNWSNVFTGTTQLAYAIKTDGTLWSWGNNGIYLGYPNATVNNNYRSPKQVGTDTWKTIAIGSNNPMIEGIKTDGTLWGWGNSVAGSYMFGNGISGYISEFPVQIGTDTDWKEIWLSQLTALGLKEDGTRWGWGSNTNGQELGIGTGVIGGQVPFVTQLDVDSDWKTLSIDLNEGQGDGINENNTLYHWGVTHTGIIYPLPTLFSTSNCTLHTDEFDLEKIVVYPNPIDDFVHIRFEENSNLNIDIVLYNQLGQELLSKSIEVLNQEIKLDISSYVSGVYFLMLENNNKTFKTKLIKL